MSGTRRPQPRLSDRVQAVAHNLVDDATIAVSKAIEPDRHGGYQHLIERYLCLHTERE